MLASLKSRTDCEMSYVLWINGYHVKMDIRVKPWINNDQKKLIATFNYYWDYI